MTDENETAEAWMALSPERDITAYDLWRCLMIGQSVNIIDAFDIPDDLRRHYKPRPVGQY
jgi:hypothetical protein